MNAVEFHAEIAVAFDERYGQSLSFQERFRVWAGLFAKYVKPTDNVLDLGCGSGVFSTYLAAMGCNVIGIDGSAEMINLCGQKKFTNNVRYVQQWLPLSNPGEYAQQDVIIASSLLEYIEDMNLMVRQVKELLRTNGLFIVSVPNQRSVYRRIERLVFALTGHPRYLLHSRNWSSEATFNQQLTALDFEVIETAYFASRDPISSLLNVVLPEPYVNSLFVGVYRKR